MNSSHSERNSVAEDQAALWAAKLDGSFLSGSDRAALDQWLAADPRNRTLLSEYCQFSADLEQQLPELVAAGSVALPPARAARRRWNPAALWFAASVAAAAAVAITFWSVRPEQQSETVATSVAQRRSLKLADGSVVELNARTSLLVDLSRTERHVRMADGEAFFTVAKDKSRPFIVETPAGSVRVTGTVFDVHADTPTDLAVTVVEGSVQVSTCATSARPAGAPFALVPGQQLVVSASGTQKRQLSDTELEDELAWRRGEAVFEGAPLGAALARFARYHGRTINVAPDVQKLGVGGRFRIDDLDGFLNDIQSFLPVQVSRDESSGAISVTPRPGS